MANFLKNDPYRSDASMSDLEIRMLRLESRQQTLEDNIEVWKQKLEESQEFHKELKLEIKKIVHKEQAIQDLNSENDEKLKAILEKLPAIEELKKTSDEYFKMSESMARICEENNKIYNLSHQNEKFLAYAEP